MRHLVVPDTQCKPGHSFEHLTWVGQYAAEKKPDVIIHLGDHWDMPSLSIYDVGKKAFEGRTYQADINAGLQGMAALLAPINEEKERLKRNKEKQWKPRLVFLCGNHEERIQRAINSDRKLDGLIGYDDFALDKSGWEFVDFLQPIIIDGIAYCHYFTSGVMGRPVSSPANMLTKKHMSCIMGHVQDRGIAFAKRADGKQMTGLFAGICYPHNEDYLTPQTNGSWAGVWMLNDVQDGSFDEMPVSLKYLKETYEQTNNTGN